MSVPLTRQAPVLNHPGFLHTQCQARCKPLRKEILKVWTKLPAIILNLNVSVSKWLWLLLWNQILTTLKYNLKTQTWKQNKIASLTTQYIFPYKSQDFRDYFKMSLMLSSCWLNIDEILSLDVLTSKWILAPPPKKYRIPKIQSTELKKVNKVICPVRTSQFDLGGRRKESQVGREGRMWGRRRRERGIWSGIGWGKRTEALRAGRKNENRQPQEIGG